MKECEGLVYYNASTSGDKSASLKEESDGSLNHRFVVTTFHK